MGRLKKHSVLISVFVLLTISVIAICCGKYNISFNEIIEVIKGNPDYDLERNVLLYQRIPRTVAALLIGAALSVSGLIYQEIFNNKLISPDILGVSSGASVGACFAILLSAGTIAIWTTSFLMGLITVVLTISISKIFKNKHSMNLLLAGIITGGFMTSIISFIKYIADSDSQLGEITYWLLGSFSKVTYEQLYILFPIILIGMLVLIVIRWRIAAITLGKYEAQSRGLNYNLYLFITIILVTLLTSASVAVSGIIGWIGLVIPHISGIINGKNLVKNIPLTIVLGSIFMIVCDILSRSFTYSEIPLSAVTGFLGTPIFILILIINRRKNHA